MESSFYFRGSKIHFQSRGNGRAVVLVHGFLGSHKLWQSQVQELSKRYRTIAVDLPGHGLSESLGYLHSMELLADLIRALLKHLKIRKIILIGHSMGGYVSLAFAEKYTDCLQGLILVNTTAASDSSKRKKSRQQLIDLLPKKRSQLLSQLVNSFFVIPSLKRRFAVMKYQNWAMQCESRGIAASVKGMMERKEREIILKFAPYPYLIVAGEKDPIVELKQNQSEVKLGKDGRLVVLEDSGHISPLEQPWKLNQIITKFLKEKGFN